MRNTRTASQQIRRAIDLHVQVKEMLPHGVHQAPVVKLLGCSCHDRNNETTGNIDLCLALTLAQRMLSSSVVAVDHHVATPKSLREGTDTCERFAEKGS